jgi:predicted XRE-type DNA-binding protein
MVFAMTTPAQAPIAFTVGSGNVFADLELPDADEYLVKCNLAFRIAEVIKRRRMTRAAASKLLGIKQREVLSLLLGRLDGFTIEQLLRFLTWLGCDVQISVSQPHRQKPGTIEARLEGSQLSAPIRNHRPAD